MTSLADYAAGVARASCEAQGLPLQIADPVLLRSLAVHFSAPAISVDAPPPERLRASAETGGARKPTGSPPDVPCTSIHENAEAGAPISDPRSAEAS